MKINEVEALVGITKKNIRFYEEQGLLSPKRNSENSYRDYGDEEVQTLRRIKLMRKLGVPIEDIRIMLTGSHTVADGMRRHLITLEREKRNLQQSITLCQQLQNQDIPITEMDADTILTQDIRVRYIAPVVIAVIVVAVMAGLSGILFWAYHIAPEEAPPLWFLWLIVGMFTAVGVGVILALMQRIREIGKGEIDDAKRY